ncbi:HepT-like ribonuclease domain-containing protein [Raineya orbicola]|jgi:uncharacterized protein with HEPN domain|uniref:DUF86 domain-containing protein n=1 Tax=Raineya orbicola TaxID=2016530 RepID=A0A2N3IJT1_9BACT|nr:HepT-like ribonuclease domain-containing protein [Raineya orbicola]PKQ70585.1 hypothetical protein Rain11_0315 [Raineya orbicola]
MQDNLGDKVRLLHILEAVESILEYTAQVDFEIFTREKMRYDAVLRQIEIIGEAASRVSNELKSNTSNVEWRNIVGLRNIVIHQYFGVDDLLIWNIIQKISPN